MKINTGIPDHPNDSLPLAVVDTAEGDFEVFTTTLTNSSMDLRLLLSGAGELDKRDKLSRG